MLEHIKILNNHLHADYYCTGGGKKCSNPPGATFFSFGSTALTGVRSEEDFLVDGLLAPRHLDPAEKSTKSERPSE